MGYIEQHKEEFKLNKNKKCQILNVDIHRQGEIREELITKLLNQPYLFAQLQANII